MRKRKDAAFRRRSEAARRGWQTRRRRAAHKEIEKRQRQRRVRVPNVLGEDEQDARELLDYAGLRTRIDGREGPPPYVVAEQRPRPNVLVPGGSVVRLWLLGIEEAELADEWEFGFVYGDQSHGVDVNVRVARKDGQEMTAKEARQVMTFFRKRSGKAPPGYTVRGVQWSDTPGRRGTREHSHRDLLGGPLAFVLDAVAGDADAWELRMGSVKQ